MALPSTRQHAAFRGHVGIARSEITPPVGIYARNWGAAVHDVAESIHRPLTVNVLTIAAEDGMPELLLIDADLGWWRPIELFHAFKQRLLNDLVLQESQLIFALTHTHAAAPLMQVAENLPGSEMLEPWLQQVYDAIVGSVTEARLQTFAATIDWHTGRCSLAANRDLEDPDDHNQGRRICGFNPASDADDTLLVGRIADANGAVRGVIVNYACHPTTLAWQNRSISPDYIGAMRAVIEQNVGGTAFFLQGMSGDLAPKHQYVDDAAVADRHGTQLAHAALATLFDMEPPATEFVYAETVESGAPLAVWKHRSRTLSNQRTARLLRVDLPLKDWPTADQLEQQRVECTDRALQERLRRQRDIRRSLGDGSTFAHPFTIWRWGEAILIGSCSEAYSQLQIELRQRFPGRSIVCMNLINGSIGYLPPESLYDVDVYPVWQTPFDRGCFEQMRTAMIEAIGELVE